MHHGECRKIRKSREYAHAITCSFKNSFRWTLFSTHIHPTCLHFTQINVEPPHAVLPSAVPREAECLAISQLVAQTVDELIHPPARGISINQVLIFTVQCFNPRKAKHTRASYKHANITTSLHQNVPASHSHLQRPSGPFSACSIWDNPYSYTTHPWIVLRNQISHRETQIRTWCKEPWHLWHCVHSRANRTCNSEVIITCFWYSSDILGRQLLQTAPSNILQLSLISRGRSEEAYSGHYCLTAMPFCTQGR